MRILHKKIKDPLKFWLLLAIATLVVMVGSATALRTWYSYNWRPLSESTQIKYFTVESGSNAHQIAIKLQSEQIIRNSRAFEAYVRTKELNNKLQAGTYSLSPSMSVQEIVEKMAKGEVAKNLLTILPGKSVEQVKAAFVEAGYSKEAVEQAFNPIVYAGHPALAHLPQGASLEGYLYPDSFQKEAQTPPDAIIKQSLDEMQKYLTVEVQKGFSKQGLSIHQGIIMSSIVMKESDDPEFAPIVAQVLLTRIKNGMKLQADPTAIYGSRLLGLPPSLDVDSEYNTYLHAGLPPGPISNVDKVALSAVANPAASDFLFFVAGDDNKVYFAHTQQQHESNIKQYCKKKCGALPD